MRGRRPKPNLLKVLMGTPQADRVNYREPAPQGRLAEAPEWLELSRRELDAWAWLNACAPRGLYTQLDAIAVGAFVRLAVDFVKVSKKLERAGDGAGKRTFLLRAERDKLAALLRSYMTELGTSPAARPRLQTTPEPDASSSEFEKLMG